LTDHNVVDSSAWLEYLTGTTRAQMFATAIEDEEALVVPVICIYEVFKKTLRERGESAALKAVSVMKSGKVVELNESLALEAAYHHLRLADSLIYATAIRFGATLWTQDAHFKDLPQVRYFPK
jgi:predicted nucleic acid-binding protein